MGTQSKINCTLLWILPTVCTRSEFNLFLNIHASLFSSKIRFLIEINSTVDVENVTIALCKDIKLFLDDDVCIGAVNEYRVNISYTFNQYILDFLCWNRMLQLKYWEYLLLLIKNCVQLLLIVRIKLIFLFYDGMSQYLVLNHLHNHLNLLRYISI